jgi:hypothetical protein
MGTNAACCHSGASASAQQLHGSNKQGVVGQRAEKLRRHDGEETAFHVRGACALTVCVPGL